MIKSKNNHMLYWQHTTEDNQILELFVYKSMHTHALPNGSSNAYYALKFVGRCGTFAHEVSDLFETESDLDGAFNVIYRDTPLRNDCTMMFVGLLKIAQK